MPSLCVSVAYDPERGRRPPDVLLLLVDRLGGTSVLERCVEVAFDRLGARELEQQLRRDRVALSASGGEARLKGHDRGLKTSGYRKTPAPLQPERSQVAVTDLQGCEALVDNGERALVLALLSMRGSEATPGTEISARVTYFRVKPNGAVVVADQIVEVGERKHDLDSTLCRTGSRSASSIARLRWTIASWLAYNLAARSPARARYSIAFVPASPR